MENKKSLEVQTITDLESLKADLERARYLLNNPQSPIIEVQITLGTAINKIDILIQSNDKTLN